MTFAELSFPAQLNIGLFLVLLTLAAARVVTWSAEHVLRRGLPADRLPSDEGEYIRLLGILAALAVTVDGFSTIGVLLDDAGQADLRGALALVRGVGLVAFTILLGWDALRIDRILRLRA